MKKFWLIGLMIIVVVIALAGCKTTKGESDGAGAMSNKNKGSVKFKNENVEGQAEVGEDVDLPDDFPKDVPVYNKNAKITSAITTKGEKGSLTAVTLETKDGKDEVAKFYEEALKQNGFEIQNQFDIEKSSTVNAVKGDMRVVIVVAAEDGKTIVGTNITTKLN